MGDDLLARHGAVGNIFHRLREWKAQYRSYRFRSVKLPKVTYSRQALTEAQAEVDRIEAELSALPYVPVTRAERKAAVMSQIMALRDQSKPRLSPDGRQMTSLNVTSPGFLVWMLIDEKTWEARAEELIGPEIEGEMTAAEKVQKQQTLSADLRTAQLREVALVDASEGVAYYRSTLPIPALLAVESAA
ncbi:hypothetical protein C5748_22015 [Phyllobacterium phragmitis]|uniref:Uncharacterized protein n=2 Tax=Phyllobacterium phragmitis TaxID=2670329 RepID=A0A2S9ILI8_9HYPH|nr:hypothetical protein C5748_22015 [Phyllobacterium phragmitis]